MLQKKLKKEISNYDYFNSESLYEKIDILKNKTDIPKHLIHALHDIRHMGNRGLHYYNQGEVNFLKKEQLINSLNNLYSLLYWYTNKATKNTFKGERYYIGEQTYQKNYYEIKQTFFHTPNRLITVNDEKILNFLFDKKIKFFIPIYQRSYSWSEIEIDEFFLDIEKRIKDEKEHFFGTVTIIKDDDKKEKSGNRIINHLKIVDGQQRFTTVVLILRAIYDRYDNSKNTGPDEHLSTFFKEHKIPVNRFNEVESSEIFEKIWKRGNSWKLADLIKETLRTADNDEYEEIKEKYSNNNIYKIYEYVNKKIRKFDEDHLDNFYNALRCLIIGINWVKNYNEFELFESINSKGKFLSNFDILKNYLMSLIDPKLEKANEDEIAKIFSDKIEKKFKNNEEKNKITEIF